MKKAVIIGGGAGGFELATQLGDKLGKNSQAEITLIDRNSYHIWKPLLHEVATGVIDEQIDNIDYASQGKQHHFLFKQSILTNIDRDNKRVEIADSENESSQIEYDVLVIAIGSTSNDFGTPGVKDHCIFLDDQNAAIRLRETLIAKFTHFCSILDTKTDVDSKQDADNKTDSDKIHIAIVGGGATGVELASELPNMVETFGACSNNKMCADLLEVTLVEAADRILPALPANTSLDITKTLQKSGIRVLTKTMITKAESDGLYPKEGDTIRADLMVWTAGVKAPDFLREIAGLESSRSNQLVVKPTLQSSRDDAIFAIGDCAYALQNNDRPAPPSAQAAHQMAKICAYNIEQYFANNPMKSFKYNDKGTIISLHDTAQGVVTVTGKTQMGVKGGLALFIYRLLYRMHQASLLGVFKTIKLAKVSKVMHKAKSASIFNNRD